MPSRIAWLSGADLDALLERFAAEGALIAPVDVGGDVVFRRVASASEVCRDYVNSLVPPKEHLLPTPERLLGYRVSGGTPVLDEDPPPAPAAAVLFGIRSCDVAGFAYLERFLSGAMFGRPDLADPGFVARREALTLLSVVCLTPGESCMCVCCAGGPALERDYDWQLTELEDGWLVEVGSARGERLAERCASVLAAPPADAVERKERRVRETVERFGQTSHRRVQTMAAARMLSSDRLGDPFWGRFGERCIECGGCSFVCPTCYCFNVTDVAGIGAGDFPDPVEGFPATAPGGLATTIRDGEYERVRTRDCCLLPGFIRQAGGGYPRVTCGERCFTRFFHKLSRQFHERMNAPGCTGCGRCAVTCMGEIGIDRVSEMMADALVGARRARHGERRPARPFERPVPVSEED